MFLFFVFILGLFVGSFLNVLVDRIPKGESPIKGRSYCDKCKKNLNWYDLIPLLSFISLKGKCRYCRISLSFFYPTIELTTGIMFVVTTLFIFNGFKFQISNFQFLINSQFSITNFQLLISLIYYLFTVSSLIVIFFSDLKYGIIPDKIVFPAIVVTIGYLIFNSQLFPLRQGFEGQATLNYFLSALGAGLFFLLLFLVTQGRGMGFGDVKFSFLMGLILGFPNIIVGLYVAFLTGAIVGCILIIWRKKRIFGTAIPFGPFLVIGSLTAIFFGERLLQNFYHLMHL